METGAKFIIPRLQGGFGNQLFIILACYAIQKATATDLQIYLSQCHPDNNPHKQSATDYEDIFLKFPNTSRITMPQEILKSWETYATAARENNIPFQFQQGSSFSPWDPASIHTPCFLEGYFQYYPPLEPYIQEICEIVRSGLPSIEETRSHSVLIHVRRGDYVGLPDYHYLQPEAYYKEALQHFHSTQHFFIFSDDIEYCKTLPVFNNLNHKTFVDAQDELVALSMMANLCTAGAICANSTFSYWGAMLGTHYRNLSTGSDYPIIIPSNWCKDEPVCLFPESWKVVPLN